MSRYGLPPPKSPASHSTEFSSPRFVLTAKAAGTPIPGSRPIDAGKQALRGPPRTPARRSQGPMPNCNERRFLPASRLPAPLSAHQNRRAQPPKSKSFSQVTHFPPGSLSLASTPPIYRSVPPSDPPRVSLGLFAPAEMLPGKTPPPPFRPLPENRTETPASRSLPATPATPATPTQTNVPALQSAARCRPNARAADRQGRD